MTTKASLRLLDTNCPAMDMEVTASQIGRGRNWDLFVMKASSCAELDRGLHAWEDYAGGNSRIISETGPEILLEGPNPHEKLICEMEALGCRPVWPSYLSAGEATYQVIAPSKTALRELRNELDQVEAVHVEAVTEVPVGSLDTVIPISRMAGAVTRRQLDMLLAAVEAGFYDIPKGTTTEEIGSKFDLSPSTVAEHLRKAEKGAVEAFVAMVGAYPGLVERLLKPRGRPPSSP